MVFGYMQAINAVLRINYVLRVVLGEVVVKDIDRAGSKNRRTMNAVD